MLHPKVSVVKETLPNEHRVILLPENVATFVSEGFEVLVETGAGEGVGIKDEEYINNGATIVSTNKAWECSNFVLKYKPPCGAELNRLHKDMHIGAIFHAEGDPQLIQCLIKSGVTAYSYEFFESADGSFPLAIPGGEVAGKLAVIYGAYHLQRHLGGSGVLLSDVVGAERPKVIIIGYGNVGGAAARVALALGSDVLVLGRNSEGLRRFRGSIGSSLKTDICCRKTLIEELPKADLVIGAILISTYSTQPIIDDDLVRCMKPGSMLIDVTCGYGSGYLPSFDKFTDFDTPVYERYGVLHCKIDKLPAAVPVTTTQAYSSMATPYLIALGKSIFSGELNSATRFGKIVEAGQIKHPVIAEHMEIYDSIAL